MKENIWLKKLIVNDAENPALNIKFKAKLIFLPTGSGSLNYSLADPGPIFSIKIYRYFGIQYIYVWWILKRQKKK